MKFVKYVDNGVLKYKPITSKDYITVEEDGVTYFHTEGQKFTIDQHATQRGAEIDLDNEIRRDMVVL